MCWSRGWEGAALEILCVVLLVAVLASAVIRPFGLPEAVVSAPAAAIVVAAGAISWGQARQEIERLTPVVAFLGAVLVLARLCADEGLFEACGAWMARASGRRLLTSVFGLASAVTVVLSLDATVVLLTPVVFATAARLGVRPKPHVYACGHLANTASLLLPVSNLTNLLAFAASGLSFTRFAALMTLPWLGAILVEYVVFRRFFAGELDAGRPAGGSVEMPMFALVTVACTLAGFVVTSAFGLGPVWAAAAGALVLGVRSLARGNTTPRAILDAAALPFLVFVLALGVVVRAVVDHGPDLGWFFPAGDSLPALLGVAALAAVLANLINNLPAVLVLLPLTSGPAAVLAVLIGVNIGPNLTYAGSLATLLWRRIAHEQVRLSEFTRLGLLTVPAGIVVSVVALWVSIRVLGT